MCDPVGVIKISDDSSTDSDMGLDSDFNSSPESVLENDDVIFIEHAFNGFVTESRSKQSQQHGIGSLLTDGSSSDLQFPGNSKLLHFICR